MHGPEEPGENPTYEALHPGRQRTWCLELCRVSGSAGGNPNEVYRLTFNVTNLGVNAGGEGFADIYVQPLNLAGGAATGNQEIEIPVESALSFRCLRP
jgi:hypothetical protein